MTMARGVTEIDRLIEQGLTLYGEGDLDGALLLLVSDAGRFIAGTGSWSLRCRWSRRRM